MHVLRLYLISFCAGQRLAIPQEGLRGSALRERAWTEELGGAPWRRTSPRARRRTRNGVKDEKMEALLRKVDADFLAMIKEAEDDESKAAESSSLDAGNQDLEDK